MPLRYWHLFARCTHIRRRRSERVVMRRTPGGAVPGQCASSGMRWATIIWCSMPAIV